MGVMDRLEAAGALSSRTLLANCTHLAWEELSKAQQHGCWMIHNARSNMSHAVGYAPAGKFGSRRALGTDGVDNDLFTEGQFALFKAREAGYGVDLAQWLAGGHRIASEIFGLPIGPLEAGAAADLVVLDYASATPLTAETLSAHLCRSLGSSSVDSVMVDGAWRVWARQLLSIDAPALFARTAEAAKSLWSRAREL
jgi:cytosine/adenosine deaminase-related metal-dependent hydrolase